MTKTLIAKIVSFAACVALTCAALAGCATSTTSTLTDDQKANRSYMSQVNQKMDDLGSSLDTFVEAVSRNDVVAMRTEVDSALKVIDEFDQIEAPDSLKDIQSKYVEGVDKLKSALDSYVTLYSEIANGSADMSEYADRIADVQALYNDGMTALRAADEAASSLS